jgi:hypothetical protein
MVNDPETIDLSLITIMLGIIFSAIVAYGFITVDYFYSGFNVTSGNMEAHIYQASGYNEPYPVVFLFVSFFFVALFFKAAFNLWKKSLEGAEIPGLQKRR